MKTSVNQRLWRVVQAGVWGAVVMVGTALVLGDDGGGGGGGTGGPAPDVKVDGNGPKVIPLKPADTGGAAPADDTAKPDDTGKTDDTKPERKDPNDPKHALDGSASLIRGPTTAKASTRPAGGLWETVVNQKYYDDVPLLKAQKLLFHGQYGAAEKLFDKVLGDKPEAADATAATVGKLEAIFRQGKMKDVERFKEGLAAAPAAVKDDAGVVKVEAEAMVEEGDLAGAVGLLKGWIEKHPKMTPMTTGPLALRNYYGQLLETQGNYAAARGAYEEVTKLAGPDVPEDAGVLTEIAAAIERSAVLLEKGRDLHQSVLALVSKALDVDGMYWPAHLLSAEILLAAHNGKGGGDELDAIAQRNPSNVEAKMLTVLAATEAYNFEAARKALEEVKGLSESADVKALEGRLLLKERLPDQAVGPLVEALKRKPQMPEARGWLAAAYVLTGKQALADEQFQAVKMPEGTPHPVALEEAADVLRDARQFPQAEKLYEQASNLAAWWSEPEAGLALLYMETGEEAKARAAFERSFKIDPYNGRASNQLTLLDIMDEQFKTRETAHFVLRYTPEDEILARLAGEWLEKVYPEVCGDFQAEPDFKTQIEFFDTHERFGVRTTGLPWIGTVGACTGRVIAMDVPRGGAKDMVGAFDWARVLRHEFTHVVTLAETHNRIPHWLTEACAVSEEQAPRDWTNYNLLCSNYRAGTLFKLADLNWGFIRPKKSTDRQLAYMQSQWVFEYLTEKYGHQKVIDFVKCFDRDLTEGEAFKTAFGRTMEETNADFLAWAGKQVEAWGMPVSALPDAKKAEEAVNKSPDDLGAKLALAEVLLANPPRQGEAERLLREVIKKDAKQYRARELLGVLQSMQKKKDEAKQTLTELVADDPKRPVTLRTLGLIAMDEGPTGFDDAEKWFLQLQAVRPLESTSYEKLAGIYLVRKQPDKAIAQLKEMQSHEQKDERIPRKLADLLKEKGDLKEAETMAYKAVRINPYNAVNHELLAQVLVAEKQDARSVEYWQLAATLQPKIPDYWAGLADALGNTGKLDEASEAAKKAVELQARSPAAKWIKH